MDKIKPYITYAVIAAAVIAAGFYVFKDWQAIKNNQARQGSEQVSEQSNNATTTPEAPAAKQEFTEAKKITAPDLNKPVNFVANLAEEVKAALEPKITAVVSELKADSGNRDNWLKLAIYKKAAGDYLGAEEIWLFLIEVDPRVFVSYNNLGDLYAYYLKDYTKAELYFLKALELAPTQVSLYRSVYEFYHYALKDEVKAKEILERGIKLNPNNSQDLKYLLDNPE